MRVCATVMIGMTQRLGVHAQRVAEHLPDQVKIVDRVHGDLDTRQAFKERPERHGVSSASQASKSTTSPSQPLRDRILQRQHHRCEAQLEIDRRLELRSPANAQDFRRLSKIAAHRLLDQRNRTSGRTCRISA